MIAISVQRALWNPAPVVHPPSMEPLPAPVLLDLQLNLLEGHPVRVPLGPADVMVWLARPSKRYVLVSAMTVAPARQAMGAHLHVSLPWQDWQARRPTHLHVQAELSDDGRQLAMFFTPGTGLDHPPLVQGRGGVDLVFEEGEAQLWLDLLR